MLIFLLLLDSRYLRRHAMANDALNDMILHFADDEELEKDMNGWNNFVAETTSLRPCVQVAGHVVAHSQTRIQGRRRGIIAVGRGVVHLRVGVVV